MTYEKDKVKELYWAVLGGSPGAFGVTTNLVFHPILNEDYPHSTAWDAKFPYSAQRMKLEGLPGHRFSQSAEVSSISFL